MILSITGNDMLMLLSVETFKWEQIGGSRSLWSKINWWLVITYVMIHNSNERKQKYISSNNWNPLNAQLCLCVQCMCEWVWIKCRLNGNCRTKMILLSRIRLSHNKNQNGKMKRKLRIEIKGTKERTKSEFCSDFKYVRFSYQRKLIKYKLAELHK